MRILREINFPALPTNFPVDPCLPHCGECVSEIFISCMKFCVFAKRCITDKSITIRYCNVRHCSLAVREVTHGPAQSILNYALVLFSFFTPSMNCTK